MFGTYHTFNVENMTPQSTHIVAEVWDQDTMKNLCQTHHEVTCLVGIIMIHECASISSYLHEFYFLILLLVRNILKILVF